MTSDIRSSPSSTSFLYAGLLFGAALTAFLAMILVGFIKSDVALRFGGYADCIENDGKITINDTRVTIENCAEYFDAPRYND